MQHSEPICYDESRLRTLHRQLPPPRDSDDEPVSDADGLCDTIIIADFFADKVYDPSQFFSIDDDEPVSDTDGLCYTVITDGHSHAVIIADPSVVVIADPVADKVYDASSHFNNNADERRYGS